LENKLDKYKALLNKKEEWLLRWMD
jgi:hypothetical protein